MGGVRFSWVSPSCWGAFHERFSGRAIVSIGGEVFGDGVRGFLHPLGEEIGEFGFCYCVVGVSCEVLELERVGFGEVELFDGARREKHVGLGGGESAVGFREQEGLVGGRSDGIGGALPCFVGAMVTDVEVAVGAHGTSVCFVIVPVVF